MEVFDRLEPESETQRIEKALKDLVAGAQLPLRHGHVLIRIASSARQTPGGQRLVALLVHLLARMKGVVRTISIDCEMPEPVLPGILMQGRRFDEALQKIVSQLSGPFSNYTANLEFGTVMTSPDVTITIGVDQSSEVQSDILLGSDGWRAITGRPASSSRWLDKAPFGPYMSATIGAAEILKILLAKNFGRREGTATGDLVFSLANVGVDDRALTSGDVSELDLTGLSIAGGGAGGTAALYTLFQLRVFRGQSSWSSQDA
jgi:hypothetical protein